MWRLRGRLPTKALTPVTPRLCAAGIPPIRVQPRRASLAALPTLPTVASAYFPGLADQLVDHPSRECGEERGGL